MHNTYNTRRFRRCFTYQHCKDDRGNTTTYKSLPRLVRRQLDELMPSKHFAEHISHDIVGHNRPIANDHPEEPFVHVIRKHHGAGDGHERGQDDPCESLELVLVLPLLETKSEENQTKKHGCRANHGVMHEQNIVRRGVVLLEVDHAVVVDQDAPNECFWQQVETLGKRREQLNQDNQLVLLIFKFVSVDVDQFPVALGAERDQQNGVVEVTCVVA